MLAITLRIPIMPYIHAAVQHSASAQSTQASSVQEWDGLKQVVLLSQVYDLNCTATRYMGGTKSTPSSHSIQPPQQ